MEHPSVDSLELMALGQGADGARAHIEQCAECRSTLEDVRSNLALLGELAEKRPLASELTHAGEGAVPGYRILREIHRGGQGVVYEAVQESTKRTVALKVVLDGAFASPARRRRFEREIELVAALRHPNVVTVYDSGATSDGRPFLAMERIEGVTLDEHASGLDSRASLPLFIEICAAINYAHQRGIIHRDLKPANILVDEAGVPHVLDFGLAKATEAEPESDTPRLTRSHEFMGTLAYASPEQLSGDPDAPDLRTDVYSLGVILYELLAGRSPYGSASSIAELARAVAETDPAPPSPDRDLATIALKALAKEPERRYQSAGELGRDVQHYLAGEPIDARRDSGWYVLQKTLRRHKVPVGVAAAFLVIVVGAAIALGILWNDSVRSEALAAREATWSKTTVEFLHGVLTSVDPNRARGRNLTVREVLDEAAARVEAELAELPELQAELHAMLGEAYLSLEMFDEARSHLSLALHIRREVHGGPHREVAESLRQLAFVDRDERLLGEAQEKLKDALAVLSELSLSGGIEAARARGDLAVIHLYRGDHAQAAELWTRSLAEKRALLGDDHDEIAKAQSWLGNLHLARSEYAEGLGALNQAVAMRRRLGQEQHLDLAWDLMNLAEACAATGRDDDARAYLFESQEILALLLGEDHPGSILCEARIALVSVKSEGNSEAIEAALSRAAEIEQNTHPVAPAALNVLGIAARYAGDTARAEELFHSSMALSDRLFLDHTPEAAISRTNLAMIVSERGRYAEAAILCREAIEILRARPGGDCAPLADALLVLSFQWQNQNDLTQAEATVREAADMYARLFDPPHPGLAKSLHALGYHLHMRGANEEAVEHLTEALTMRLELEEGPDPDLANNRNQLGGALASVGRFQEAEEHLRTALETRILLYGEVHPAVMDSHAYLGRALLDAREFDESLEHLEFALDQARAVYGAHSATIRCLNNLADWHMVQNEYEEALDYMYESVDVSRVTLGDRSTGLAFNLYRTVQALGPLGLVDEAVPLLEESYEIYLAQLGSEHNRTKLVREELETVYLLIGDTVSQEAPAETP